MSKKKETGFTVTVNGIGYDAFARLKWQQFLRGFSLAVALLVLVVAVMGFTGRLPEEIPVSSALILVLLVAALLVLYRSGIRREHRRSGLGSMVLKYSFDRDGWTVRTGDQQVTVPWSKTYRVRRTDQALMLYPSRKSVNLVPAQCLSREQMELVIAWCTGKKPGKA